VARQAGAAVEDFHPRSIALGGTALGLLVGEPGEPAQVPPVGAGAIAAVGPGQLDADGRGEGGPQRIAADLHPGLQVAGTGLEHHTRFVPLGGHGSDHRGAGMVQVDQDVAGVVVLGVGVKVDIAALLIAPAQEANGGQMGQLVRSPQPFSGERSFSGVMNQPNEIQLVRHGRELAANGLSGEQESPIEHTILLGAHPSLPRAMARGGSPLPVDLFLCRHGRRGYQKEGALKGVFRGMRRRMVRCVVTAVNLDQGTASRSSGPSQAIGRPRRSTLCPSSAIRLGRLFLGGLLASMARLRFTGVRRISRTPACPGEKGTFLLCQPGGHFYFALTRPGALLTAPTSLIRMEGSVRKARHRT
jgi:hypothetical protein